MDQLTQVVMYKKYHISQVDQIAFRVLRLLGLMCCPIKFVILVVRL